MVEPQTPGLGDGMLPRESPREPQEALDGGGGGARSRLGFRARNLPACAECLEGGKKRGSPCGLENNLSKGFVSPL